MGQQHPIGGKRLRFLLLAILWAAGCATTDNAHTPLAEQGSIGEVLVVASDKTPQLAFEPLAGHRAQSAVGAGAATLGDCLAEIFRGSSCSGSFCGAVVIVGFGICGGAALIAGGMEAAAAPRRAEVDDAIREFRAAVDRRAVQNGLRDQVARNIEKRGEEFLPRLPAQVEQEFRRTGDLKLLDAAGVGAVLETNLTRADLDRTGRDKSFLLSVRADARLLRTRDGAVLYSREFHFTDGRFTAGQWSENGSERLIAGLAAAYETLGAQIFDSVLRLYPFPYRGAQSAGVLSAAFGLAPIYPATRGQLSGDKIFGPRFEWTLVDSLQPQLSWQTFPREVDVKAAPEAMGRVRNVRYDLVIARENMLYPSRVVYRRDDLIGPVHLLEQPLQAGARYFWSVRASFDLDGRRRVTEWSLVRANVGDALTVPNIFMFRFRTPGG